MKSHDFSFLKMSSDNYFRLRAIQETSDCQERLDLQGGAFLVPRSVDGSQTKTLASFMNNSFLIYFSVQGDQGPPGPVGQMGEPGVGLPGPKVRPVQVFMIFTGNL